MDPIVARGQPTIERFAVAFVAVALIASVVAASSLGVLSHAADLAIPGAIVAVLGPLALLAVAMAAGAVHGLAARLPVELDGWFRGRRIAATLWAVLAVASVANTARFGAFMADRSATWGSIVPFMPDLARHECLPAYVRAAELAARGQDNLWDPADYERADDGTPPSTSIPGLGERLEDAYEYPPPFAVAARAAIEVTSDYQILRAGWFGINGVAFLAVAVMLAIWVGGRAGATALLLVPALAFSTPVLLCLQFGQAHLLVVVAAVAALPLFSRGRFAAGGILLGFAIATKIFPGLLLVHLAGRRQWRALAATLAATAAMVAIAALVLGPGTVAAFVTEHLPAVASGEAFPHARTNFDNASPYGLVFKLDKLGVAGMDHTLASRVLWAYGVVALGLVVLASRRRRDRAGEAVLWLGILALATLRSPFAPTYSAVTALWLLSLWIGDGRRRAWRTALVTIAWIFVQGTPPVLGETGNVALSLIPQTIAITIAITSISRRAASERGP
jgi:hypothetical protein